MCNLPQDDFNIDFQGLANCINAVTGLIQAVDKITYRYHITARRMHPTQKRRIEYIYREVEVDRVLNNDEVSLLARAKYPELQGKGLLIQQIGNPRIN